MGGSETPGSGEGNKPQVAATVGEPEVKIPVFAERTAEGARRRVSLAETRDARKKDSIASSLDEQTENSGDVGNGLKTETETGSEVPTTAKEANKRLMELGVAENLAGVSGNLVEGFSALKGMNDMVAARTAGEMLRKEANKPENRDSVLLRGGAQVCTMLEKWFGFNMGAKEYSAVIGALHKDVKFSGEDLDKVFANSRIFKLVETYKDSVETNDEKGANVAHDELMSFIHYYNLDFDDNNPDFGAALDKFIANLNKTAEEEISAINRGELDHDDSAISAHFAYKQLTSMTGGWDKDFQNFDKTGDPEILYAQLMHNKAFNQVLDYDIIAGMTKMPPGSVLFFNLASPKGGIDVVCGVVGPDGALRIHTDSGLTTVTDFGKSLSSVMSGSNEDPTGAEQFMSQIYGFKTAMSPELKFRGAFLPGDAAVKAAKKEAVKAKAES